MPAPVLYSRLEIATALRPSFDGWDSNPDLGGECAGGGFGGQEKKSNGHGSIVILYDIWFFTEILGTGFAKESVVDLVQCFLADCFWG